MEKINVAELLKDCPKGMELDCIMFEGSVVFEDISEDDEYPIGISTKSGEYTNLTKYGQYLNLEEAKCVIFPKGKTSWEGFKRPFKDGDILTTNIGSIFIFSHLESDWNDDRKICKAHVGIQDTMPISFFRTEQLDIFGPYESMCKLATKEEKTKLFQAIKDNGYKWNEKTKTLEKLVKPEFKDGDIAVTNKGDIHLLRTKDSSYCAYRERWKGLPKFDKTITTSIKVERLATEEEKVKFFDIIKANGYKWNEETKTLEELPKFKVGDRIRHKNDKTTIKTIGYVYHNSYALYDGYLLLFTDQDMWELAPNKFDINILVPFESKVLVRNDEGQYWIPAFWGCKRADGYTTTFGWCKYCVPFEGNEHLLETNNDCNEFYKTWKN